MTYFNHWKDVPKEIWRWKDFSPQEIACHADGSLLLNEEAMDRLQKLRDDIAKPMRILSGYRSPEYNKSIGGVLKSKHMKGEAFDISMVGHNPSVFFDAAKNAGFLGFGFYPESNFMHIDLGPLRHWGRPFNGIVI